MKRANSVPDGTSEGLSTSSPSPALSAVRSKSVGASHWTLRAAAIAWSVDRPFHAGLSTAKSTSSARVDRTIARKHKSTPTPQIVRDQGIQIFCVRASGADTIRDCLPKLGYYLGES